MKLVTINALFGEVFAVNPNDVVCVNNMTDQQKEQLVARKGGREDFRAINTYIRMRDEAIYSTETFDEVVSKINAAYD